MNGRRHFGNRMLKLLQLVLFLVVLCGLCASALVLRSCGSQVTDSSTPPEGLPLPGEGTCDNIGEVYPDNPFSGWPVIGGANWGLVTAFYCDPDYFEHFGVAHYGIDLGYTTGTPVIATSAGVVTSAGWHERMGLFVRLCQNGWCATYMHLSSVLVEPGSSVSAGQVLGEIGNTGNSTGAHLHYQINDPNGGTVDPAPTMG
jgi:hypothetical protein